MIAIMFETYFRQDPSVFPLKEALTTCNTAKGTPLNQKGNQANERLIHFEKEDQKN